MAYEKQTWQTGDVITQEKLNHMEDGIAGAGGGGGIYIVTFTDNNDNTLTADKTRGEILEAFLSGALVIGKLLVAVGVPTTITDIIFVECAFVRYATGSMDFTVGRGAFGNNGTLPDSSVTWTKF